MAKVITAYAAADGKEFPTAMQADGHDLVLSQKVSVDAFIAELELGAAEATRARKYISFYAAFMTTFVAPPVVKDAVDVDVSEESDEEDEAE